MPASRSQTAARARRDAPSSVQKACRVLSALSDRRNARLTDIAAAAGLGKATALRLLDMLSRQGFVVRNPASKAYALGTEVYVLAAALDARRDLRPQVRPSLIRLAGSYDDTAIFSVPSGWESICVDLQLGNFPIRANYLDVGSRRPLGVGAGSLALLAWMPDAQIEAVMPLIAGRLQRYPRITPRLLEKHVVQARRQGYAVLLDVVVEQMGGIAMPILGLNGAPIGAISIAALSGRIKSREDALAAALKKEIAAFTRLAAGSEK